MLLKKSIAKSIETDKNKFEIVVVGVSAGGAKALKTLLSSFSIGFPLPIVIVQHLHKDSDDYYLQNLQKCCSLKIIEAADKDLIKPGFVYFAPANYHVLVENNKAFSLSNDEKINYARPSIDLLFETASYVYGNKIVGTILTGANSDGSKGLRIIKEVGGLAIVQDPKTAEYDSMPVAAISVTQIDNILSLEKIGPFIEETIRRNR